MSASLTAELATRAHILHPGDVCCVERGERLETLLGSCVAIILTDRHHTVGAMCHVVHSRPPVFAQDLSCAYGDAAIETLYALMQARGFSPQLCDAYVYGGGNMFPTLFPESHVGEANGAWALTRLARDGVRVVFHDLGGDVYRRLSWEVGPALPEVLAFPALGDIS